MHTPLNAPDTSAAAYVCNLQYKGLQQVSCQAELSLHSMSGAVIADTT